MSDAAAPLPALWRYPERLDSFPSPLDAWVREHLVGRWRRHRGKARVRSLAEAARAVHAAGADAMKLDDASLVRAAREAGIAERRSNSGALPIRLFALVSEVATRAFGFRPHEEQVMGALSLWRGAIAEMATGEGKTCVAALCAAAAALSGRAVHVVTANDYLAARDAKAMAGLYGRLGLTVAAVVGGQSASARRAAYGAVVCYGAGKEIVFDHLRDRLSFGGARGCVRTRLDEQRQAGPLLRGLDFAIVDEADSVLVDAARTPLILSGEHAGEVDALVAGQALSLVRELTLGVDWRIGAEGRGIELTEQGAERLARLIAADPELESHRAWSVPRLRDELARHALSALSLFREGEHYVVRDGKVVIIDEFTGRMMPDRQWSDGLHQMIERKEGCEVTRPRATLARLTFQRFFPRYRHLCGMTGTAAEVTGELWSVYGLMVDRIPTHRPSRRVALPDRVLPDAAAKWAAVAAEAASLRAAGRAVLIGTRTVEASERVSAALAALELPHAALNARQDAVEAAVIAAAGQAGRITVATNMAGRGADIRLDPSVAAAGGLAVLITERHEAGRIDRQLAGRTARQGDPGSVAAILALDDPLLRAASARTQWLARLASSLPSPMRQALIGFAFRQAQRGVERAHAQMRRALVKSDRARSERLSFAGMGE